MKTPKLTRLVLITDVVLKDQDFISPYYKRDIYENYLIKYQNKIEKRNIKNEILKLLLNGVSVSEISKKFNVKPKTIWQLKYENKKRNFV
jgi:DNA-binding NarL/FixJ family response regulator